MLNLLVLRCHDINETKQFYEQLGLVFIKEQHGAGPKHFSTVLKGLVLELYPSSLSYPVDTCRLGFSVEHLDQLPVYDYRLITYREEHALLMLKDPDGRTVEIAQSSYNPA